MSGRNNSNSRGRATLSLQNIQSRKRQKLTNDFDYFASLKSPKIINPFLFVWSGSTT